MGGAAGHMMHLYEDPELTFGDIKGVLEQAADGRLVGTEKVDGQNLYLSYSVKESEARFARTENEILNGGLGKEFLSKKFPKAVLGSFTEAMNDWSMALESLDDDAKVALFGIDAEHFYNTEVLGYKINVIGYNKKAIVFHQVGHKNRSEVETNEKGKRFPTTLKMSGGESEHFQDAIRQMEAALKNQQPGKEIVYNKTTTLGELADKKILNNALRKLNQTAQSVGLSDAGTMYEYTYKRIAEIVNSADLNLEEEAKDILIRRIMGEKHLPLNKTSLQKLADQDLEGTTRQNLEYIFRDESKIKNEAIRPVERAIYDFSIEALANLESFFIEDEEKESKLLSRELDDAINTIKTAGGQHRMDMLAKELERLGPQKSQAMKTAAEGFVFTYKDETYKFTGAFSPLNQILGMTQYKRGTVEPAPILPQSKAEKEFFYGDISPPEPYLQEANDNEQRKGEPPRPGHIVLYPGGFKPLHAGHFELAKRYADQSEVKKVIMLVGPRVRTSKDNSITITKENTFHMMKEFYQLGPKVVIEDSPNAEKNPMRAAYQWVERLPHSEEKQTITLAASSKDPQRAEAFVDGHCHPDGKYCKENVDVVAYSVDIEAVVYEGRAETEGRPNSETVDLNGEAISASVMREDLAAGDKKNFKTNLPYQVEENADEIFDYLRDGVKKTPEEVEEPSPFPYSSDEELEEMSTAGGGAASPVGSIQGAASRMTRRTRPMKRKKPLKKTSYMYENKETGDMKKLRYTIRKMIEEKHKMKLYQEQKLRKFIRKTINEDNIADAPTSSTGINKLVGVLKIILPTIETAFKGLTTGKEQRESFRKHLIKAIIDTLSPHDALRNASGGEVAATTSGAALEEDIEVKINDDKFIDFEPPKKTKEEETKEKEEVIKDIGEEEKIFPTIPGLDETGRDEAVDTYKKIIDAVVRTYRRLHNKEDRDTYKDYLVTNLLLYFDKYENDISSMLGDISTPEYEKQKADVGKYSQEAAEQPLAEVIKKAITNNIINTLKEKKYL